MLNKTGIYVTISVACMLTFSACSTDDVLSITDTKQITKTPIELTVGIVGENPSALTRGTSNPVTRSVVTTDKQNSGNTAYLAQAFSAGTSLYMVIKSEDASDANPKYTRTIGYAQETATSPDNSTSVKFATDYVRYWEDSHSRNSRISIYSVCVPGYHLNGTEKLSDNLTATGTVDATKWSINGSNEYSNSWTDWSGSTETTIAWPLRSTSVATQDASFITNQDLCFSNNVANPTGGTDSRIKFDTGTKKFKSGRMVFYHALTWVTFKIKKGEGFESTDAFAFTETNQNIVLKGFNTGGTFDITQGEFKTSSPAITTGDITSLALTDHRSEDNPTYQYELDGLMLPGSELQGSDKDALDKIYFTIDHNLYHITKQQLATALNGKTTDLTGTSALTDDHKMRPGVHYIFTMTVGKQKVDNLTAAVVPWETVEADETTPTNARITISLMDNLTKLTNNPAVFDLYRSTNTSDAINDAYESYDWTSGYTQDNCKAYLNWNSTSNVYEAKKSDDISVAWYWPDNKTFYHFRTVEPVNHTVNLDATNGDYISLTAGSSYTDVCWGAPFYKYTENNTSSTEVTKLTYSTSTGFDNTTGSSPNEVHQISKAIGPTTGSINMVMFHMMSDVTIKLKTNDGGNDAVTIADATVSLSNTYTDGKVLMGNGRVVPGSTVSSVANGVVSQVDATTTYQWKYGFVPQSLDNVVLTITTTDNNQYVVDMKDVKATTIGNNLIANPYTKESSKYVINAWYPNYKYTYTFKLTKTGITQITATLADWETVTAEEEEVQIK